jgi:hypothetical protein
VQKYAFSSQVDGFGRGEKQIFLPKGYHTAKSVKASALSADPESLQKRFGAKSAEIKVNKV